jgi:hypothetical protein
MTEIGSIWHTGTATLPRFYRLATFIGNGSSGYSGDLAWNMTCATQTSVFGTRAGPGGNSEFVTVNRASGAQTLIGNTGFKIWGLAYDGTGTLWGTTNSGQIGTVATTTGVFTPWAQLMLALNPVVPYDLASTPRCLDCDLKAEVGDAPDSTNHSSNAMSAYGGVPAAYPVVYDETTGTPVGPIHWFTNDDHWLGHNVSQETDADLLPDDDGPTNIDPPTDTANRDLYDDGLVSPLSLPNCQMTTIQNQVTVVGGSSTRYINAWIDFNSDGDWADTLSCVDPVSGLTEAVPEWIVQDQAHTNGSGIWTITSPSFRSLDTDVPMWLRVTASDEVSAGTDGQGPVSGFEYGETEDYLLAPDLSPGSEEYDAH